MIIGTNSLTYNHYRNFAALPYKSSIVEKKLDLIKLPAYAYFRLANKPHAYLTNLYYDLGLNNVDVYHFFNAVNMGDKPWVTTFENYLPRGAQRPKLSSRRSLYRDFVIKRLLDSSCKKLIAMSRFAYNAQLSYMREYGKYADEIENKLTIIHPSQKLLIDDISKKEEIGDYLSFTIVGADFFRKGGMEILNVFSRLLDKNFPVKLNIISNLSYGDYASKTTKEDFIRAKSIISKYPQIRHFNNLKNEEVLKLLKDTDIGLLPSYDETYGYSVLEAQAAGCPVITTNGSALSEINNNEVGWLIDVPLDDNNSSIPHTAKSKALFSSIVEERLFDIILKVLTNKSVIREKGISCLEKIRKQHNPGANAEAIEKIYRESIK